MTVKHIKLLRDYPQYGKEGAVVQVAKDTADRLIRNGKAKEAAPEDAPRRRKTRATRAKPNNKALSAN
jgi:ribosomal protein L9